jgi:N-acetylglucosaminyldiphosphoundecaprenol N-acetyl-beta-D-mannosaminyltransferase
MIQNFPLGHLKVSQGNLNLFLSFAKNCIEHGQKAYCIPLHITKYELSKKDEKLAAAIRSANVVLADGFPINLFGWRLGYRNVCRITGIEFAEAMLFDSKKRQWGIYLLGAQKENLDKAVNNLARRFNQPKIVGYHHGYFDSNELQRIIEEINKLRPDILLLGLGMPQKEYFVHDYFDKISAIFWLTVGGAFDIWAEAKKRSPFLLQKLGMEWAQRSFYNIDKAKNVFKYGFSFLKEFLFFRQ